MSKMERYYGGEPHPSRPLGHGSKFRKKVLDSIALLAVKYELDPIQLLHSFSRAWNDGESKCGPLKIERRGGDKKAVTFLITLNDDVIWQFPIDTDVLEKPDLYESSIPVVKAPMYRKRTGSMHIGELRDKIRGVTVTARVLEVPPKVLVKTRYGGESFVSNIILGDGTGTIRLSLWNSQIDDVAVGDIVKIEKATVAKFQGELQLRMTRWGNMSVDESAREESLLIES